MAIVSRFFGVTKDHPGRPKETECGYGRVEVDGVRYFLLESYGAADRRNPGKTSQSFHLDDERARELRDLLDAHLGRR